MRYLLLIAEDQPEAPMSEAEWAAMMGDYAACTAWLTEQGWYRGGEALQPSDTATSVSVVGGHRLVTDGPFAETKEQLAGYYLVDVPGLDDAIEAASRIPGARHGRIEIRPILELG